MCFHVTQDIYDNMEEKKVLLRRFCGLFWKGDLLSFLWTDDNLGARPVETNEKAQAEQTYRSATSPKL